MGVLLSSQTGAHDTWKSDARYAMEAGTYCVICGSSFDIEGDIYKQDPKEPRYQVSTPQFQQIAAKGNSSGCLNFVF
jgi:hypothetical protein